MCCSGSGKTASYMIPVLSKLMGKAKKLQAPRPLPGREARAEPLVVIVVPTRELAIQIFDEARRMCYRSMLRPCVAYGGLPSAKTREELQKGCDILIATPGRLCDLMNKPNILTMARVKYTIIDEADEMLDQDWSEELQKIMAGGDHIFMMFSATFPKLARNMAREYMAEDYVRITVGRPGQAHKNIRQNVIFVEQDRKREAVHDLLYDCEPARTIIFCNSKAQVDHLDDFLYNRGMPTTSIHADRNQREREDALRAFRTGRAPILIATGVSSRGWDIMGVKHVINYDLPSAMYGGIQEYTHRIGRTARIGHQGLATSFYNDRNEDIAQELVNVLVECECDIPGFLSHLKPEDTNKIDFDDNSEEEEAAEGFGATGGSSSASGEVVADSWGRSDEAPAAEDTGFGADTGNTADTSGW
nr:isoform 2 of atp-dependent rna helicase ddx3x [Quercus suber]